MSKYSSIGNEFSIHWFSRMHSRIGHLLMVAPGEGRVLFWSFTYFFSLLCSYYIVRPIRDEMGIAGGVEKLQWMFGGEIEKQASAVDLATNHNQ